jgi:glycosyltransferase involved in cell wall biosynthesis
VPKKIIYCSERSINFHESQHFYSKKKSTLIYNGFNETSYFSSKELRLNFRKKEKINKSDIIIGYAGRYARQKNIFSMLNAFSKLTKIYDNVYLYMIGRDISSQNKELVRCLDKLKINDKVYFLKELKSLSEFYNGIDFLLLPSHSESFPNVVAESMLCSTPVLSSDAGCSRKIINSHGFVMAKNDQKSIFDNLKKVLIILKGKKKEWKLLKKNSRLRIKNNFSIPNMGKNYLKNWIF